MAQTKIRTTNEPGIVREVDDAELLDLSRLGLVHSKEGDKDWRGEGDKPARKARKTGKAKAPAKVPVDDAPDDGPEDETPSPDDDDEKGD